MSRKITGVKKQIFRTETRDRVSVLNDHIYPTNGKAQNTGNLFDEMGGMFDHVMGLTFDLRRNKHFGRRKLEQEQKAIAKGDDFTTEEEKQIDLDENLFGKTYGKTACK